MKNIINDGNVINYTNSTGAKINSGDVVPMGKFCGIAITDIANGATGAVSVKCSAVVAKKTKTDVISVGDRLIYDSGVKVITAGTTIPAAILVGYAIEASAATDETVKVLLSH